VHYTLDSRSGAHHVECNMRLPQLAEALSPLAAAAKEGQLGGVRPAFKVVQKLACAVAGDADDADDAAEDEQGQQESTDRLAAALVACCSEVDFELKAGNPQLLLSSLARHPALAPRITSLSLSATDWESAADSLLALTPLSLLIPCTSGGAAGSAQQQPPLSSTPPCFSALQRVQLRDIPSASAGLVMMAAGRLQAPRLSRVELGFIEGEWGDSAAGPTTKALMAVALEALCMRPRPVGSQGQPLRLVVKLGGLPAGLLHAMRRTVEAAGRYGWLTVAG
jgi:hypothetical protein